MHEIYLVELYPILAQLFVRGFPVCIGLEILQHAVLASAFGHPDGSAVGQFVFHESQSLLRSSSLCRRSSRNDGHIFSNRYDLSTTVPIARTDTQKDDNHNNQDNDKPYQPIVLLPSRPATGALLLHMPLIPAARPTFTGISFTAEPRS